MSYRNDNDEIRYVGKFLTVIVSLTILLGIGATYAYTRYDRVDEAIKFENRQHSGWTREQALNKVNAARDAMNIMKGIEQEIALAIPSGMSEEEIAEKEQEFNSAAQKFDRLVNEIKTQVSLWNQYEIEVPAEVTSFLQELDSNAEVN